MANPGFENVATISIYRDLIKIPHMRNLVYFENGVANAIEAETDALQDGSIVDKEKSLERYKQTDKQLIGMMKSIIE